MGKKKEIDSLFDRQRDMEITVTKLAGTVESTLAGIHEMKSMLINNAKHDDEGYKILVSNCNANSSRLNLLEKSQEDMTNRLDSHETDTNDKLDTLTMSSEKFQKVIYWCMGIGTGIAFVATLSLAAYDLATKVNKVPRYSDYQKIEYAKQKAKDREVMDKLEKYISDHEKG